MTATLARAEMITPGWSGQPSESVRLGFSVRFLLPFGPVLSRALPQRASQRFMVSSGLARPGPAIIPSAVVPGTVQSAGLRL
jgi:hypothetical protein